MIIRDIKAVGGKWFPEELLWYVRYGAIVGGPLEKHIDNSKNPVKSKKHLHIDNKDTLRNREKHLQVDEY